MPTAGASLFTSSVFYEITPNDGVDLPSPVRAIMIGVGGALKVNRLDGQTVTLSNVPAGTALIQVARVWAAGTTATGLVGLV